MTDGRGPREHASSHSPSLNSEVDEPLTMDGPTAAFSRWRFRVLRLAGEQPKLYYALHRLVKSHRFDNLVWPTTDVCIEGPPGSGNTYFVTAFSMANPDARIAHHHHVPAQLKRAEAYDTPTVVLVRNPIDCALSRASAWGTPAHAGVVLDQWMRFFRDETLIDRTLLVSFETATRDSGRAIAETNRRFGTSFDSGAPDREAVFSEMDRRRHARMEAHRDNPNRPDDRRPDRPPEWGRFVNSLPVAQQALERFSSLQEQAD